MEALCINSKPHEISNFQEEWDEDACGHRYIEKIKHSDTNDEKIQDTLTGLTPEGVARRTKQLLEGIQEEFFSGGLLLMQHINTILERLHTDMKNLR